VESFDVALLYPLLSKVNHSCLPNAVNVVRSGRGFLFATRPIAQGEEITINYLGSARLEAIHYHQRQALLQTKRSFTCLCALCKNDAKQLITRQEHLHQAVELNALVQHQQLGRSDATLCAQQLNNCCKPTKRLNSLAVVSFVILAISFCFHLFFN